MADSGFDLFAAASQEMIDQGFFLARHGVFDRQTSLNPTLRRRVCRIGGLIKLVVGDLPNGTDAAACTTG
jgi:hypothetical protein